MLCSLFYGQLNYNMMMYSSFPLYKEWALNKQKAQDLNPSIITINDSANLNENERSSIVESISQFNFFIYELSGETFNSDSLSTFAAQFGLEALDNHLCLSEDKMTKIFDDSANADALYIPYTSRPINWHTDGYYNIASQRVLSFLLHCEQAAFEGGENALMDPDHVFIHLMNENPNYLAALMQADVMTIPENRKDGVLIRPETSTSIFSVLNDQHDVLMRYSMRKKNIFFKKEAVVEEALQCMDEFINSKSSPHTAIKLKAGQGVVTNNVLHKRTGFKDKIGSERLYYRARFYNRINFKN